MPKALLFLGAVTVATVLLVLLLQLIVRLLGTPWPRHPVFKWGLVAVLLSIAAFESYELGPASNLRDWVSPLLSCVLAALVVYDFDKQPTTPSGARDKPPDPDDESTTDAPRTA